MTYEHIFVELDRIDSNARFGINHEAFDKKMRLHTTPIYQTSSEIELSGICYYAEQYAGFRFTFSIYLGNDRDNLKATLNDYMERRPDGQIKYRTHNGVRDPLFSPPQCFGMLDKVRGEKAHNGFLWMPEDAYLNLQLLISRHAKLYVSATEIKIERRRCFRNFDVQTDRPE
jgi:hypothetical protein